jgi:CheY-like chemotaxis protein
MRTDSETVLVVDDDRAIRESLGDVLSAEGYRVLFAENGAQALEVLRASRPTVVLLDLMMPVMSGWEVLDEMQSTDDLSRIPVVVVSAMCAPGAAAFIEKPVDLRRLLRVVGEISGAPPETGHDEREAT